MKRDRDDFVIDHNEDINDDIYDDYEDEEALQLAIQFSMDYEEIENYKQLERVLLESKKKPKIVIPIDHTQLFTSDMLGILIDNALSGPLQSWKDLVNFTLTNRCIQRSCIDKLEDVKKIMMKFRPLPDRYIQNFINPSENQNRVVAIAYTDVAYSITSNTVIYIRIDYSYYHQRYARRYLQDGLLCNEEAKKLLDASYDEKYEK